MFETYIQNSDPTVQNDNNTLFISYDSVIRLTFMTFKSLTPGGGEQKHFIINLTESKWCSFNVLYWSLSDDTSLF